MNIKHGRHGKVWFGIHLEEGVQRKHNTLIHTIYDQVMADQSMDVLEAIKIIESLGFILIDRNSAGIPKYANSEGLLVEVYVFHQTELTVTFSRHDAASVAALKRRYDAMNDIAEKAKWEAYV